MKLDSMLPQLGEWLRGTGPESDIVISTRIRLARNLADMPFTNRAAGIQKAEVESKLRETIAKLNWHSPLHYIGMQDLNALNRQFLVERQLISREMANVLEGPRGVAFDDTESVSLMVNEEDQLRMQVMRSGFALDQAWETIDRIDDMIEQKVQYAFHDQFGYLTACPTNVGTGMRASVMLHLPGLGLTKQIEKAFKAMQKINLVVRGLYGEGSRASGDFFQISNQMTLGKSEPEALNDIRSLIHDTLKYERFARSTLLRENKQALQDRVARALGTLQSATMMTSEETMELLSAVRLGVHMHLIEDLTAPLINELFLQTQPAHLQKIIGEALDGEARNAARARYLRQRLREISPQAN
ncbi:protein arginine kinase [Telmatocola sphagniphila]|uniref:Protein arginine kinase n=1 Tax=Telmatocola sphagniphila TaxID=1123043 RepID=A0A8E6B1Z1_9BACT|nr:protein arginine kinase [Telmatocola sphagniphila]QVL29894.1 protein arginine kinase [Telmatocola sphagniphila]